MSISISLCMIVKNEEDNLEACLESAKGIADEINVVDTGSTDKTVEIAKRYTDRIFHFEWVNDFSKARNFSFSKATKDFIFWLDADDTISSDNREKILKLKETLDSSVDYVSMLYHYRHFDNGEPAEIFRRERLLKRSQGFKWKYPIHEYIIVSGKHLESDIFITHNHREENGASSWQRNTEILESCVKSGEADARVLSQYADALMDERKYDEAIKYIEQVIELPISKQPLSSVCSNRITAHQIYMYTGEFDAALKVLTDSEWLLRDKSEYYCTLGAFYLNHENDVIKALGCFERALKCDGKEKNGVFIKRDELYYYLVPLRSIANCHIKLGQYGKALTCFKKVLEYTPRDEEIIGLVDKLERIAELERKQQTD